MTDKELIRSALEALESCSGAPHWKTLQTVVTALRKALANEALDKKAENARELGLDYEPAQRSLPDVLVYEGHETLQYIEGWNDCRELMKGMR